MSNTSVVAKWWLPWVLANAIGTAGGWAVGINLSTLAGPPGPLNANALVLSATLGATIGLAQWLAIEQWVRADFWILASTISWSAGFLVSYFPISFVVALFLTHIISPSPEILFVSCAVGGAVLGANIGLAQWFVLRNRVSGANSWIRANIIGYAIGFGVSAPGIFGPPSQDWPPELVRIGLMALFGAISGGITGVTLEQLLRHPRKTRSD